MPHVAFGRVAAVVTLVRHGDAEATDRILDALEADAGWRGDRDPATWRCELPDARDIFEAERTVVDVLQRVAPGWQDYFTFER